MPLFERIVGPLFPTKHTRSYIARTADAGHPATVLMGSQDDFAYDVMAELVFPDKAAFDAFIAKLSEEENKARIEADEKLWLDREKTRVVVLGETSVTEKEV